VTDVALYQMILQAISTLSVASGLVYGALQLRNWRIAQYSANHTKLVELQLQLRKMRMDDAQLTLVDPQGGPAGSQEELREYVYELMQLSLFELAWFSHEHGQLPDDYFRSWVTSMSAMAGRRSFQAMWRSSSTKIVHDRFRAYMETLVAGAAPADPAGPVGPDGTPIEGSAAAWHPAWSLPMRPPRPWADL
jgi:hypothetical protein